MSLSGGFKVVVMGKGPKAAALLHTQVRLPGQTEPWECSVPGLSRRGECARRNAQVQCLIPSSLSLSPYGEISAPGKPLCWGSTSSVGGGDSQEGGWRWEPSTRTGGGETRWLYEALPAQRDAQIFGCPGLLVALCGPVWIWRLCSHREGRGQYRSKGASFACTSSVSPMRVVSRRRPAQAPGMRHQPGSRWPDGDWLVTSASASVYRFAAVIFTNGFHFSLEILSTACSSPSFFSPSLQVSVGEAC